MSKTPNSPYDFIRNENTRYILKNNLTNNKIYSGVYNGNSDEIKTNFEAGGGEKVISCNSNAFIVMGRDRDGGLASGQGGKGWTGASAIDLIAGHMGYRPIDTINGEQFKAGKDFKNDSARVYISQMSDVDTYFEIPKVTAVMGNLVCAMEQSVGLSTVAAKADTVRLIARENIKLVTFHNHQTSMASTAYNGGIDIMAGCNVMNASSNMSLQPMVKGDNLIEFLKVILERINDVQTSVVNFMDIQKKINDVFAKHQHQGKKAGLPTSPIVGKQATLINFRLLTEVVPTFIFNYVQNTKDTAEYFNPLSSKYINSTWNRVN